MKISRVILLRISLTTLLFSTLQSCQTSHRHKALDECLEALSGHYHNSDQARSDSAYHEVELHITPIWKRSGPRRWFYREESTLPASGKPYLQVIHELQAESDTSFLLDSYMIPGQEQFAGSWRDPASFEALPRDSLFYRKRCTVRLTRIGDGHYRSSTMDRKGCTMPTRPDIAYLTMDIEYIRGTLSIWHRSYDFEDRQVKGPRNGGYRFTCQEGC